MSSLSTSENVSAAELPGDRSTVPVPTFWQESRTTLRLALPLIAGQLGQMLMGVTDTLMIARLGVTELGVATLSHTLLVVPFVIGIGLLSSVSVRVSQARGAGEPERAREALRHGTWLALGFGLLTVAMTLALTPWRGHFGQPQEVTDRLPAFLLIGAGSLVPALLSMTWKNHTDALNHPWPAFWILLGAVLLNILLNWLLIWGHGGFPALGLEGAAWATLVARTLGAVVMFWWLTQISKYKSWTPPRWWRWPRGEEIRSLWRIGLPASLHLLTEVGAFAVCSLLIGTLGAAALAAHQVAITCVSVSFMIPLGLAMAMTVRIGELAGAGQPVRMRRVLLGGWLFSTLFMAASMVVFLTHGAWLAGRFVTVPEVAATAATLLVIGGLFQLVDGLQVVSTLALRGVNDARVPAWCAFAAYWLIAVPLGAWLGLGRQWGATGPWTGLAVGLAFAALMLGARAWKLLGPARSGGGARSAASAGIPVA